MIVLVLLRHMLSDSGVASDTMTAQMLGNHTPFVNQRDTVTCDVRFKGLGDQRMGDRVIMFIDLDMIIQGALKPLPKVPITPVKQVVLKA